MHRTPLHLIALFLVSTSPLWAQSPAARSSVPSGDAAPFPSAAELADRCAQASGGAQAWAKVSTLVLKGSIEMPALQVKGRVELYHKSPSSFLRVVSIADKQYIQKHGFDGQTAWEFDPRGGLRQLSAAHLEQAKLEAIFDSDVRLKQLYPDMKVLGKSKVGDRDAYVVLARTRPSAKPSKFYFDAQSGLRIAEESDSLAPNGQIEKNTTFYEDYRSVAGVQIPFRLRFVSPSVNFTITLDEARANDSLDDSLFAFSSQQPPAPPAGSATVADSSSPDVGTVEGNLYKNKFFGLQYQFPEGWTPHGEETKKHLMEIGRNAVSGNNALENGAYQDAEKRTLVLLSVFRYPLGTPVDNNDSIQLLSEDVRFAPGVKSGREYLQLMAGSLKRSNLPIEFQGEPTTATAAGQTFYRQDILLTVRGKSVYEAFVVSIVKEHALSFVFVGSSEQSRDDLAKTLETLRFSQQISAEK